ncbi:MAG TPA: apolipoprotein N-acyltransferase, partial [Chroococcales cyanobacterium]
MPAIIPRSKKKKGSSKNGDVVKAAAQRHFDWKSLALLALSGAITGLSAPGFDQWYLVWIGLVPLLLGIYSSPSALRAFLRATVFGIAYNAVYISWLLNLQPLDWLGFNGWQGWAMAAFALAFHSVHQGAIVGSFGLIARLLPVNGSIFPRKLNNHWQLPGLLVLPLLWELVVNRLGNAHCLTGAPWTMLEYSQYRQLPLIQIAGIIGGVGIGALIVMTNTAIAAYTATFLKGRQLNQIAAPSKPAGFIQLLAVAILIALITAGGAMRLAATKEEATLPVSVLQGNINIDRQKTAHRFTLEDLLKKYLPMAEQCGQGLTIWTESSLPTYLNEQVQTKRVLSELAQRRGMDMIVGAMDKDALDRPYNSAYGITNSGTFCSEAYHKRYLVPFGEYTPALFQNMPEWMRRMTNTPAGGGFESGNKPCVLPLRSARVAALICFETLSPELVSASVRDGGQLIVNVSDLAW